MKKLLFLLTAIISITVSSCAPGPVGVWNYSVTGTPQGDYNGVLTISKTQTGYSAKMTGTGAEIPFDKFDYDKASKKTSGDFSFQGMSIGYSGTLSKDDLKGSLAVAGMEFPFLATRKK